MLLTISLSAQRIDKDKKAKNGERLEQQRIAYITAELDLTVEEAQGFWPMYNDYQSQKKENGLERKVEKDLDQLTEQESQVMLAEAMEAKIRQSALEAEFINKLERVLTAKKRLKLLRVERKFKKSVLKRYQKRMKRGKKQEEKQEKREKRQKKDEEENEKK